MSTWSDQGLPGFEVSGYGFSVEAALLRTPFSTTWPNQTRRNTLNAKTFSAEVLLTQEQLFAAEAFLRERGYSWFTADLLAGSKTEPPYREVTVRLCDEYQVSVVGYNLYKLRLALEGDYDVYVDPTSLRVLLQVSELDFAAFGLVSTPKLVTSKLYPLEVFDGMNILKTVRMPRGDLLGIYEAVETARPDAPYGTLILTEFYDGTEVIEEIIVRPPTLHGGELIEDLFDYAYSTKDAIKTIMPALGNGTLSGGDTEINNTVESLGISTPTTLPYGDLEPA